MNFVPILYEKKERQKKKKSREVCLKSTKNLWCWYDSIRVRFVEFKIRICIHISVIYIDKCQREYLQRDTIFFKFIYLLVFRLRDCKRQRYPKVIRECSIVVDDCRSIDCMCWCVNFCANSTKKETKIATNRASIIVVDVTTKQRDIVLVDFNVNDLSRNAKTPLKNEWIAKSPCVGKFCRLCRAHLMLLLLLLLFCLLFGI